MQTSPIRLSNWASQLVGPIKRVSLEEPADLSPGSHSRQKNLQDKLKAADVVWGFLAMFCSPPHLHERWDQSRRVTYRESAADEHRWLQST